MSKRPRVDGKILLFVNEVELNFTINLFLANLESTPSTSAAAATSGNKMSHLRKTFNRK